MLSGSQSISNIENSTRMKESTPPVDVQLDTRQYLCPMPLLKAKQALNRLAVGQVLEVLASDSGSWRDFHQFVQQCHHQLLLAEEKDQQYRYRIKKGEKPASNGVSV